MEYIDGAIPRLPVPLTAGVFINYIHDRITEYRWYAQNGRQLGTMVGVPGGINSTNVLIYDNKTTYRRILQH